MDARAAGVWRYKSAVDPDSRDKLASTTCARSPAVADWLMYNREAQNSGNQQRKLW